MSDTHPTAADDFWGNSDQGNDYDPGEVPDEEYYEFDDTWDTSAEESTSIRPGSEPVPAGIPDRFVQGLNPAQRQAVETLAGPLMVIAGPGSGKTRVLTHRIAALLATGTLPWQVLAVTFTNKAAAEMRQRLTVLLGEEAAASMWVATFHSACLRILRYNAEEAGLPKSFSICDTSDAQRIIKGLLSTDGSAVETSLVKETLAGISRAKNAGKSSGDLVHSSNPHERALAQIMHEYEQRLLEIGAVDFDDILLKTLHLLQRDSLIAERYQSKFHHILVDEYQDTNAVQMQIVEILAQGHNNLCVVGDTDQSVYSWRGSSPEIMLAFREVHPDAQMVVLEQNYRSTPEILKVAQAIIDPNPALHRPHLFTDNASGAPVRLYVADDDREEATWVASQIKATRDDLDAHAILVRTNAQTRSFEEALSKSGMAYQVVGSLRFYDRAEVKDALSYLRVALNPKDAVNLARCINTPKRGIGDATVDAIVKLAQEKKVNPITLLREDLAGANELPTRARKPLAAFLEVYDAVVEAASDSPAAALEVVAEKGGLRAALEKDKSEGPDRVENLQELIAGAREFVLGTSSTRPEVGLVKDLPGWEQTESFLENVALVSAADDEDVKVSRVSVLTAHASKGKEFPHVFVVGVEDTLYPHERSKGDPASEEEERRLLFVAASRAERTLTITRCKRRFVFNSIKENPPSPFLRDLPDSVERVQPRYPQRSGMGGFSHGFARPPARVQPRTPAGRPSSLGGGVKPRAAAGPRLSVEQLQSGIVVEHPVFGRGTVVSTERNTVTITFGSARKVLDVSFAPLSLAARDA